MFKKIRWSLDRYRMVHNHTVHPDIRCNLGCHYVPTFLGRLRGAR